MPLQGLARGWFWNALSPSKIPRNPLRDIAYGRDLFDRLNNDMSRYSQLHVEKKRLHGIRSVLAATLVD
jgi:hypothetical protein